MEFELFVQIISIFIAVIAVALPALIAVGGYLYLKRFEDRIDNLSDQVDQIWDRINKLEGNELNSD